jgi:hypothetical protein
VSDGNFPNLCFVEDSDSRSAIIALMRHHNPSAWPQTGEGAAVHIKMETDLHKLFKASTLRTEMQRSGGKALGIVVDAEQKEELPAFDRIREFVTHAPSFSNIPSSMPKDGLILVDGEGKRLGLWIMPDNESKGMLEDFLSTIVPYEANELWQECVRHVAAARARYSKLCTEIHLPKAHLHSWLALQDPPGERIGTAIAKKFLDPSSPNAKGFVDWFNRLYKL